MKPSEVAHWFMRGTVAFAAQSLEVMRSCKLDPSKVNLLGGAIATGHPLGATGAIKTATAVHAL